MLNISTPNTARVDDVIAIRASGLDPARLATLGVRTRVDDQEWQSVGLFAPDEDGAIDPARSPSLGGTYLGRSGMGLFWSQTCTTGPAVFPATAQTVSSTVTLRQSEDVLVREVARSALTARCGARPVQERGLVGTLFHPRARVGRPVLVLGGSEGGQNDLAAALLASHGYAALALTYFGADGLPGQLHDVPIGYFRTALDWLVSQPESHGRRAAIYGNSKGGEAALLTASLTETVAAVAAMVPSGVLLPAHGNLPAWRDRSGGLPPQTHTLRAVPAESGDARVLRAAYSSAGSTDPDHPAAIPVERIGGPVLIAAASDDCVWPSSLALVASERLRRAARDHADKFVELRGAGHLVQPPYLPTTPQLVPYGTGWMLLGGNPRANARAAVRAWRATLRLLRHAWDE